MEKIKVVHLITDLNTGGAEMMLFRLVTKMDPRKFSFSVVSIGDGGPVGKMIQRAGIPVMELGLNPLRPDPFPILRLLFFLKKSKAQILQTWLYHADLLGILCGKLVNIPRIIWNIRCSDMHFENYRPFTYWTVKMCRIFSRFVDGIIVNSYEGMRVHRMIGYQDKKMIRIPNGIDTSRFRPDHNAKDRLCRELGISKDNIIIGLIARFDPMKDHKTFLKAASLIAKKRKDVVFVLAGKGIDSSNRELMNLLSYPYLKGKVFLLGIRNDQELITSALDIATSSSLFGEGFSNTIAEAMACGIPCVVTDVGDSAMIVGNAGLVVSPGNPDEFSRACLKLIEMGAEKRKELGRIARKRIEDNFEIRNIIKLYEGYYRKKLYEG